MATSTATLQVRVQKFGTFLSGMVMPNIGAFIAWGLLTALFIPTGWAPNGRLNELVSPTITYLLPLLIGYTGGSLVYGRRGGVAGALGTIGVIIGSDVTMLMGAMVMGPLGGWVLKRLDALWAGKIKPGLEMLVDNFAMGIAGALLMLGGYLAIGPVFRVILNVLTAGVQFLINAHLLPFVSLFVQPGQVLFLNNAINHGVMVPIGIEQVTKTGQSILFLVEANGGVWTGVALAFALFGRGVARRTAPAAFLIMGLGGIAEVVFPFVLSKPRAIVGPIVGNIAGLFTLQLLHGGTVAAVSPGSIFALIAMSPRRSLAANLAGYFVALVVTVLVTGLMLRTERQTQEEKDADEAAEREYVAAAATTSSASSPSAAAALAAGDAASVGAALREGGKRVEHLYVACDAGMGSSVMAESILRTKATKAMLDVHIAHVAITEIPDDADLIVTTEALVPRVRDRLTQIDRQVPVFPMANLLDSARYDALIGELKTDRAEKLR